MKIFVFGAGASLAAQNQGIYTKRHPERAPLTDNLFDEQYRGSITAGLNLNTEQYKTLIKNMVLNSG